MGRHFIAAQKCRPVRDLVRGCFSCRRLRYASPAVNKVFSLQDILMRWPQISHFAFRILRKIVVFEAAKGYIIYDRFLGLWLSSD